MEKNIQYNEEQSCIITEKSELFYKGSQITEPSIFLEYVENLKLSEGNFVTQLYGEEVLIEAEEQVLIASSIRKDSEKIFASVFSGIELEFSPSNLLVDEFDRFFTLSNKKNIPIYFSPTAQNNFFDLCDEFDDETFVWDGIRYTPKSFYSTENKPNEKFWTENYKNMSTGWDMNGPHPFLENMISQLKLVKSEILVLGAGRSHDAFFLSQLGHNVTAIDISPEAIAQAKHLYPESSRLKYVCMDVFNTPSSFNEAFDIVFDHTFYCAISPDWRSKLSQQWLQFLRPGGSLIGIFFSMFKSFGPPYGGSELELKLRTKKFRPLYWNRIRMGPKNRIGKEFFAMLQKKN